MALLCLAFVMSGAPVAASMPSHDMSQMMSHAASPESECADQQTVPAQSDDCCQTDACKNSCAAHISMIIVAMSTPLQGYDFNTYAAYIDHSSSQLGDPSDPPPIA